MTQPPCHREEEKDPDLVRRRAKMNERLDEVMKDQRGAPMIERLKQAMNAAEHPKWEIVLLYKTPKGQR